MATHSGQPRLRFDSPYSEVVSELARFEASLAGEPRDMLSFVRLQES